MRTQPGKRGRVWLQTSLVAALLAGCGHLGEEPGTDALRSPNQQLLDEVKESAAWFHARKTRPIWAKPLEREQQVDTLEGPVLARPGDSLCRGEAGEVWPQKTPDLEARYAATDVVDGDGWRKYEPRTDTEGVMAAQVMHPFRVQAEWGWLSGKAGDYVVKNYRDRDIAYPEDVWIVDQRLFHATYAIVKPE